MATLPTKTLQQYVDDMVASWAGSLGFTPQFTQSGDAFLALMQTVAGQLIFVQAQVQLVNAVARAQTSGSDLNNGTTDADLDTFFQQFGFFRVAGTPASGAVVFGSFSPAGSQVLIPAADDTAIPPVQGTIVQTPGGAIQYQVVGDSSQPTWNASLNAYVLDVGQTSLTATVRALLTGTAYNVTANQLSQIGSSVAGVDTVTNPAAITNGTDSESNQSYRTRFVMYLNSLSKATYGAIASAILGIPGIASSSLVENINQGGGYQPGEFIATIDDGSGTAPDQLLAAVQAALEDVRGFTILAIAQAVSKQTVTEGIVVRVAAGFTESVVNANVAAALQATTNASAIGATLYVSTLEGAALEVAGVVSVQPGMTLINSANEDLPVNVFKRAFVNLNAVVVGNY